ncbi:MAG: HD domain-containing protein [Bacteriovoracaceae bacterium]|nr:HD domain-containing protein [Bacteriovoracaceae bacterium]
MSLKILVADPDSDSCDRSCSFLVENGYEVSTAMIGKNVQLKAYKNKYFAIVLDWAIRDHSVIEVLKYLKLNSPSTKVIVTISSMKELEKLDIDKNVLARLGACDVLVRPFSKDSLIKSISGELQFNLWKNTSQKKRHLHETGGAIKARDDEFTRLKIDQFYSSNRSVFDIYIRINPNHYIKILHAGEAFDSGVIKRYKEDKNVEYLYFRTHDRTLYIRFMNDLVEKTMKISTVPTAKKIQMIRNITEKYVEEIYTSGIKPQMVEEGEKICEHISGLIHRDRKLSKVIRELENFDPSAYSHAFLVVFFSTIISNQLSWTSKRTREKITLGAMLHDIGKLKLSKSISLLRPGQMDAKQLKEYQLHPQIGVEMLENSLLVTEPVRQIILQHHETIDGCGFPRKISGKKIFPLAQIVGLVDICAHLMTERNLSPVEAYKAILKDERNLYRFDPNFLKVFGRIFINIDSNENELRILSKADDE